MIEILSSSSDSEISKIKVKNSDIHRTSNAALSLVSFDESNEMMSSLLKRSKPNSPEDYSLLISNLHPANIKTNADQWFQIDKPKQPTI